MARPRADLSERGLTSGDVAKQLRCSRSNVDRLRKCGLLPGRLDRAGVFRYQPHAVAEAAKKLGRAVRTDGERAARVYAFFLAPGFKPTSQAFAQIVVDTREHPDVVLALWEKFTAGAGTKNDGSRDVDRLEREYDEQIAAMDRELERRRRAAFIPGDPADESPPSSRS
jgi:hypothetical protein